nr:MAG TPA: hypothetical protein [Caudoviricetes sp.]
MSYDVLQCPMMSAFRERKNDLVHDFFYCLYRLHLFNSVLFIKKNLIYLLTTCVFSDMIQINYEVNIRNEVKYYGFVLRIPKKHRTKCLCKYAPISSSKRWCGSRRADKQFFAAC